MTAITCINCGVEGVLKVYGLPSDDSLKVFRRIGRNHASGHLHYQCPDCMMVLLVDPVLIRENVHLFKKTTPNYSRRSLESPRDLPGIYPPTSSFRPAVSFSAGPAVR